MKHQQIQLIQKQFITISKNAIYATANYLNNIGCFENGFKGIKKKRKRLIAILTLFN
jgi:hypothetical protein